MNNEHLGKTEVIVLPSGRKLTIRESNGDDDAILSNMGNTVTGQNVYNFLANIIVQDPIKPILTTDIVLWPLNDRNVLLFKARIMNYGHEFKFSHIDPEDADKREDGYTEDLKDLDGDLGDPNYTPKKNGIFLYPKGNLEVIEFSISSKKKFRIKILNGILEKESLDVPEESLNRNSPLLQRHIEWVNDKGQWERIFKFNKFTSREMSEIREAVNTLDPQFNPTVIFTNRYTKKLFRVPLMSIPTFFFPE